VRRISLRFAQQRRMGLKKRDGISRLEVVILELLGGGQELHPSYPHQPKEFIVWGTHGGQRPSKERAVSPAA
jgi:hypothetical protein